jgi:hypothetical protein
MGRSIVGVLAVALVTVFFDGTALAATYKWTGILVDPAGGVARMAVAQPVGSPAVEVLNFKDAAAGRRGPFALQMHNKGLFDEFANIAIEVDPAINDLITTKPSQAAQ